MATELDTLRTDALKRIKGADTDRALEDLRVAYLGRNGQITKHLKSIRTLPKEDRPTAGAAINAAKAAIETALEEQGEALLRTARSSNLTEAIDVTLPGRQRHGGGHHPVNQTITRIESLFVAAGYRIALGPEIEDDYHNFEALNIPANHPARAMHDTFYLTDGSLLRTHTSPVQVRVMQKMPPPIRIICPGRVYRKDLDRTHTPMFHQVEGLVIDRGISFADLKGTVLGFLNEYFEREVEVRFRPSYFPFTEPSAEVDIMGAKGWTEIMGCGMVHPNVLSECGIDTEIYSGFAFGFGADRMTMLKYGIDDLRMLFENDIRFLQQLA
ncbi:MAG: phenylalanine--tRNA ligase subunit alpha [Gammaproteobacteria bacterium]|nr:phenylalanine--tRNA ligase subunit alpha [Gammaproteobacteria bacterium]